MLHKKDIKQLKSKSIKGGAISIVTQAIVIIIQFISTVVLARLLTPDDYGLIAMITVFISFATLFRDFGLSTALIQKKKLNEREISNIFWINVGVGFVLSGVLIGLSPLVGWFYSRNELVNASCVLSLSILINSFGAVSSAMLTKNLQFGKRAVGTIVGVLVTFGVALVCAIKGFSYYSLIYGTICGGLTTTSIFLIMSPVRLRYITFEKETISMLKFGGNVTGFNLMNYFARNLDNILLGRFYGAEVLGLYGKAYSLLIFPINSISQPIRAVTYPVLCSLQSNLAEFRNYVIKSTGMIAFVSMPLVAFMGINSKEIIYILLGESWNRAGGIFAILSLAAFVQPVNATRGEVMLSMGYSDRYLRWGVIKAIVIGVFVCFGVVWGPEGVAWCYVFANYILIHPSLKYAFKNTPLYVDDFYKAIHRAVLGSVFGVCVLHFVKKGNMYDEANSIVLLILSFIIFSFAYIATYFIGVRGRAELNYYLVLLKGMLRFKNGV